MDQLLGSRPLADDLGYGDVQCNNPERGKIPTPNDYTATALTSGQRYIFRVAAVGPLGQGPWSDEAGKMAP